MGPVGDDSMSLIVQGTKGGIIILGPVGVCIIVKTVEFRVPKGGHNSDQPSYGIA